LGVYLNGPMPRWLGLLTNMEMFVVDYYP